MTRTILHGDGKSLVTYHTYNASERKALIARLERTHTPYTYGMVNPNWDIVIEAKDDYAISFKPLPTRLEKALL